jgi:hypothetical protein
MAICTGWRGIHGAIRASGGRLYDSVRYCGRGGRLAADLPKSDTDVQDPVGVSYDVKKKVLLTFAVPSNRTIYPTSCVRDRAKLLCLFFDLVPVKCSEVDQDVFGKLFGVGFNWQVVVTAFFDDKR